MADKSNTPVADFYADYYADHGDLIQMDGWDSCIVGAVAIDDPQLFVEEGEDATGYRLVYSRNMMVAQLMGDDDMSYEDADEFISFNVERAIPYAGLRHPIMIETPHHLYLEEPPRSAE